MAATPGKKVKQGIETYLQTSQNLQQSKDQPLTDPMANVAKNVTIQTTQAAGQATKARDKVAEQTDPGMLNDKVQVDPSAYAPPSQVQTQARSTTPYNTLGGYLGLDPSSAQGRADANLGAVQTTVADQRGQIGKTADAIKAAKEGGLAGIEKALLESTGRVTDADGNIIGSNKSLGQVAPLSTLETNAQLRQEGLAAQDPNSNIDALAALFGVNYDDRLAGLSSQIYGNDIAQIRGEAAQNVDAQQAAEKGRTAAMERYLGQVSEGKENVGKARETLGKNIDAFVANAEKLLKDFEKKETDKVGASKQEEIDKVGSQGVRWATDLNKAFNAATKRGDGKAQEKAIADLEAVIATMSKFGLTDPKVVNTLKGMKSDYIKRTSLKPNSPNLPLPQVGAQSMSPIAAEDGMFWTN